MDDCGTGDSAPSADCSSALDTSTSCVSHTETGSSNHHSGTTDTMHHSHDWHPIGGHSAAEFPVTGHGLHGIGSSAPFAYVPGYDPYNPQSSYDSTYMSDRRTTSRPKVYGRQTIVLNRTDAQNRARNRKLAIGMCFGVMIAALIPIFVLIFMMG